MCALPYENYIFDLYGTLVDIHTDEDNPAAWAALARFYSYYGAIYTPEELQEAYRRLTEERTAGCRGLRRDSHEAFPEIEIEEVFLALFTQKGADADLTLAIHAGQFFRAMTTEYLRLYDGTLEMLQMLRRKGAMRALGLDKVFDAVYLSSSCGCKKPDLRFFNLLLEEHHLDPARSIMTGNDAACDIAGAKAAGLATLYVHSNISPREPLPDADFVMAEMDMKKMGELLSNTSVK